MMVMDFLCPSGGNGDSANYLTKNCVSQIFIQSVSVVDTDFVKVIYRSDKSHTHAFCFKLGKNTSESFGLAAATFLR